MNRALQRAWLRYMGPGKQVVLPSDGHRANGVFNQIVIDLKLAIGGIECQLIPPFKAVVQRLAYCALRKYSFVILKHPAFQVGQNRNRLLLVVTRDDALLKNHRS